MSYVIPPGSHRIPLEQAKEMTTRYLENMDKILSPDLVAQNILPISETFRKDAMLAYFSNDYVAAIRIYYGMSADMQIHAILIGVDKDGVDILPKQPTPPEHTDDHDHSGHDGHGHGHGHVGDGEDDGQIFEDAIRCPTYCPPPGCPRLNSK